MKYYLVAGEASGDLHASYLIAAIKKHDPHADIRGWGGDLMEKEGMALVRHYKETAYMGFVEVLANLRSVAGNIKECKNDILQFQPDALILVDYPGFNLRIAKFAKKQGFNVFYYIAPKAWAWKKSRGYKLKKSVDKLYSILPFEKAFFNEFDIDTEYVGNPLMDQLSLDSSRQAYEAFLQENNLIFKPIISLFPGSRKQEIESIFPDMLEVSRLHPDYQFVVGGAPSQEMKIYQKHMKEENIPVLFGKGQDLMKYSKAALITSGTATLEAALLNLPQVICYKGNRISIEIARRVVKIKYIGLANLIMDKPVIPELIQEDMTIERMNRELDLMLHDRLRREQLFSDYELLRKRVGGPGASEKVANSIISFLKNIR